MEGQNREKYEADINQATTEDEKKKIKMEFEAMEMKLRKRRRYQLSGSSNLVSLVPIFNLV